MDRCSIPFHGSVIFHRRDIDHILFAHPTVDGHLGCSQCLAIMSNAAMKICLQILPMLSVLLGI